MKLYIASDHAGLSTKSEVIKFLEKKDCCELIDLGTHSEKSVDYTDFAHELSKKVLEDSGSFGVLICGTGIGMSMAANKHKGIRAALCYDSYTAKMARSHNDANVLCFGARVVGFGVIESILEAWIDEPFAGERHEKRVKKIEIN